MRLAKIVLVGTILAMLFATPAAARVTANSACPGSPSGFKTANNVGATFTNSGDTTTYFFSSFTNENPVNGVPGLVKYCVYPSGTKKNIPSPTNITPLAHGADGELWIDVQKASNFSFVRPDGNGSDIPLDGTNTTMGTATWPSAPPNQTILLHINDPSVCASLYGATSPGTCFVLPGQNLALSCTDGDDTVAYNAMPFGVVHCPKSAIGFEATATNEFGDEVALAGTARKITSLKVEFNSYGCSVSGHWNTNDCVSSSATTFPLSITAKIYTGDTCTTAGCNPGSELASSTQTFNIPFRPSKDDVNCTGTDAGKWFDPLFNGGVGGCVNSLSTVLTFPFASETLTDNVIWTVQFNTSHSGYTPQGQGNACNSSPGGCGYDSLNVGDQTFTGAPYAGTDVAVDVAWISFYNGGYPPPFGSGTLQSLISELGWADFRPLGEIITTP